MVRYEEGERQDMFGLVRKHKQKITHNREH